MARIFSGIKPTADIPHLGNYIGALRNWASLQGQHETIYCVVDLHSLTVPWEPKELGRRTRAAAASLIASGIDPLTSTLFVQSDVREHSELAWTLTCLARMGELGRMTQYKDKARNQEQSSVGAGLFNYPVLMAADILAHKADLVPIGDDQVQHLELARDLADRFNRLLGETFPLPQPFVSEQGSRVMSLDDPLKKMDKSAERPHSVIWMNDSPDAVRSKISRAVTDSGRDIVYGPDKPAISNLLDMFCLLSDRKVTDIEDEFQGKGYADFKSALTEVVIAFLQPFQQRFDALMADEKGLEKVLVEGAEKARAVAAETLSEVRKKVGLWAP